MCSCTPRAGRLKRNTRLTKKAIGFWLSIACLLALSSPSTSQTLIDPRLQVKEIVSGLNLPTNMAFIGTDDILVLQKNDGRVRRVLDGVLQPGEVLDVAVDNDSERGLLGIAVHPGFPATAFVYLYYTESSTGDDTSGSPTPLGNRVYRFTWDGSALINPVLILDLPVTPGPNHDGGIITFGPDGKLYVVIGDLNRNGQLENFPGGSLPDDTAVILRVNDDGTIPNDNPFFAQGGNLAKYYAYGIRNSFGLAFDPVTGELWDTENGPQDFDEINLVERGFNSGWEQIMGPDARDPQGVNDLFDVPGSQYVDPKFSWLDTVGPTAILFLDSARFAGEYQNDVFVGDINNGTLYHFEPNGTRDGFEFDSADLVDLVADNDGELQELIFGTGFGGIADLKVGPDGKLYVLSLTQGKIFSIMPAGSATPGLYDPVAGTFFLRNSNDRGPADLAFGFGPGGAGFTPLIGDWDGNPTETVGLYFSATGAFFLRNTNSTGPADITFGYGPKGAGLIPLVGDWDGDGVDTIGLYDPVNGVFFLRDTNSRGPADLTFGFGPKGGGFIPLAGDWDGDGIDTVGLYFSATGAFFLRNTNSRGPADITFGYGPKGLGFIPLAGDYDGQ